MDQFCYKFKFKNNDSGTRSCGVCSRADFMHNEYYVIYNIYLMKLL